MTLFFIYDFVELFMTLVELFMRKETKLLKRLNCISDVDQA